MKRTNEMTSTRPGNGSDVVASPFFVISCENDWVHVYDSVRSMLHATDLGSGHPGALEFFDVEGRRLAPVFDGVWALSGLRHTGERANEIRVQRRLRAVVQSLRATVDERLSKSETSFTRAQVLASLPTLNGEVLAECFNLLSTNFGDGNGLICDEVRTLDNGSFLHNLFCHP
jgi:hypothetical protein